MKKRFLYPAAVLFACLLCFSCKEEDADVNQTYGNGDIPKQVTNVRVINQSGQSVIKYDRPDDLNLKYVRATYFVNGNWRNVNASYYADSLIVDGFPESAEYDIQLYSVNYQEGASEPVEVKVHPEIPPYELIADLLVGEGDGAISPTFGGIKFTIKNPTESAVSVGVLRKYGQGEWEEISMIYTSAASITKSVRGQKDTLTYFGVYVRDRWGHISDTVAAPELTPWTELKCDKSLFKAYILPGDTYEQHTWGGSNTKFEWLWDEANITGDASPCYHTKNTAPMPQHFTIDLGKPYNLSRIEVLHRGNATFFKYFFNNGYPKNVRFWGSMTPPCEDGSFDCWQLIGEFELKRPSGIDVNQDAQALTDDDKAIAGKGVEVEFPENTSFRYFRFETMNTWGRTKWVQLGELTFFGIPYEP